MLLALKAELRSGKTQVLSGGEEDVSAEEEVAGAQSRRGGIHRVQWER